MPITMKQATLADVDTICRMLREIAEGMENQSHFVGNDPAFIRSHIQDEGITYFAEEQGDTMGLIILDFPGEDARNLGRDIGLPLQALAAVVHMDTILVLPAYRGRGLQKEMLAYAEEQARRLGYVHYMATVHPDNLASLKSFLRAGYAIRETKPKYGGVLRHVLYKRDM